MPSKRHPVEMTLVFLGSAAILAVFAVSLAHTGLYWIEYDTTDGQAGVPSITVSKNVFEFRIEGGGKDDTYPLLKQDDDDAWCGNDDATEPKDPKSLAKEDCCSNFSAIQGLMITATACMALLILHYVLYAYKFLDWALEKLRCSEGMRGVWEKVLVYLMPALAFILSLAAILIVEMDMKNLNCGDNDKWGTIKFDQGEYQEGYWLAAAGCTGSALIAVILAIRLHLKEDIVSGIAQVQETKMSSINSLLF